MMSDSSEQSFANKRMKPIEPNLEVIKTDDNTNSANEMFSDTNQPFESQRKQTNFQLRSQMNITEHINIS